MEVQTFQEWCEANGRRWIGAADFDEFKRNARDYEAYLATRVRQGGE